MSKKKEKFTTTVKENLPLNKYEFEFVIVHPGGKADPSFIVEAEGKTEAEAIEAAKAVASKGNLEDDIISYTGRFKITGVAKVEDPPVEDPPIITPPLEIPEVEDDEAETPEVKDVPAKGKSHNNIS